MVRSHYAQMERQNECSTEQIVTGYETGELSKTLTRFLTGQVGYAGETQRRHHLRVVETNKQRYNAAYMPSLRDMRCHPEG
jgi:hypothetical protein